MSIVPSDPKSLIQDRKADLITCKSDKGSIKNEIAIIWTTFSKVYGALKGT